MRRLLIVFAALLCVVSTAFSQSEQTSSLQDRKALIHDLLEQAYNVGDIGLMNATLSADYIRHPADTDRVGAFGAVLALRAAMPDLQMTPELILAEGDLVAARFRIQGTFTHEMIFQNAVPIVPNGQAIRLVVNTLFRFNAEGQIIEEWNGFDNLTFLAQIGTIPQPPNAPQAPLTAAESAVTDPVMIEGQRELVRLYFDRLNVRDFAVIQLRFTPEFSAHNPFGTLDRDGLMDDLGALYNALPNLANTVEQVIVDGEWAVALYTMRGTFTAPFAVADAQIPPTGRALELPTLIFFRFNTLGQIIETWELYDSWSFLTQLGLLPTE